MDENKKWNWLEEANKFQLDRFYGYDWQIKCQI